MQLSSALVPLFDHPLADLLAALPPQTSPEWDKHQLRQGFAVQSATRSIMLRWLSNDWRPGEPPLVMRASESGALTDAALAVAGRLQAYFGGTVAKLFLAELPAGAVIEPHRDKADALTHAHRCHLPVLTNDGAVMTIGDEDFHLAAGTAYEFDNTRRHGVRNGGTGRRVHLICDILPDA